MGALLKWLYRVLKRPIVFAVAAIVLLNVFAASYTICSNTFLNSLCTKEQSFLRHFICTRWDHAQLSHRNLGVVDSTVMQPYARYLDNEDNTLSYKLPYALRLWEQAMRSSRISIGQSKYSLREQERFYQAFSDYIEQSVRATRKARIFGLRMMNNIYYHTFASRQLMQKLRDGHPRGNNVTIYMNGPLARSMQLLNTYGMVYLPMGLQPFQKNVLQQPALDATELMKSHVGDIVWGLEKDIVTINALRQALNELAVTSENVRVYTAQLLPDSRRALITFQPQWWELWHNTFQYRLNRHMIEQRASWLGVLRDTLGLISEMLRFMADDFQWTIHSCHIFQEQLIREGEAARFGWNVSDWMDKQADDLESHVEDLRFNPQNFKEELIRFDEDVFHL